MKKMASGGGLREGRHSRISDETRKKAAAAADRPAMTDKQAADFMGREVRRPPAQARRVTPPKAVPARPLPVPRKVMDQDYEPPTKPKSEPKAEPKAKPKFARDMKDRVDSFAREVSKMKTGGRVRGDGCAIRGKTKGRFV
jgi:hypothetical protein